MKKFFLFTNILILIIFCGKLSAQCPGTETFTSDGTWTAPATGGPFVVVITCNGAGGGNGANSRVGGSGAQTIGTFTVQESELLNIIVGIGGSNNAGPGGGGGAGGGSAVINCGSSGNCASGTLLIAAGGGGGAGSGFHGGDGQASEGSGDPGLCDPAGGGGGLNGTSSCSGLEGGQASFTATSSGGTGSNNGGNGGNGFGGGGAGYFGVGGGGGGHSGGRGGPGGGPGNGSGQGGESYNTGSNQTNTSGGGASANTDGSVVITCSLIPPASSTWTGTTSTDWATPGNWSDGVPGATTDVTINDVTNDPIIGAGTNALAKSVLVNTGAVLTITSSASLEIDDDGAPFGAMENNGTVENNGTITIGATTSVGNYGIDNSGTFNNNAGGVVNIDRSTGDGINVRNASNSFTNAGTINIGANASTGSTGIRNDNNATFNNTVDGAINIDRSTDYGIRNLATFTNAGTITVGAIASPGSQGIDGTGGIGTFNNLASGIIHVDRSTSFAIVAINNSGTIIIGANAPSGIRGITGGFTNNAGGQLHISNVSQGIKSSVSNSGTITIGESGPVTTLVAGGPGSGILTNNTGGVLKGTGTITASRYTHAGGTLSPGYSPGTMTFNADEDFSNGILSIEIDGLAGAGVTGGHDQIVVSGTATLGGSSVLNVDFGSYAPNPGQAFTIISATSVTGDFATINVTPSNIEVSHANGVLTVAADPEIYLEGNGALISDGDDTPNTADDTDFGGINNGSSDTHTFTIYNTGAGDLTIDANGIIINSTTAGVFTLGTVSETLPHSLGENESMTFEVVFTPDAGGGTAFTGSVQIENNDADEDPYNFDLAGSGEDPPIPAATTWTGAVSTDWATAGNWSDGVPGDITIVTINDGTYDPVISSGTMALALHVRLELNTALTIDLNATLTIDGNSGENSGMFNLGTVNNNGFLTIGATANVGSIGIWNSGSATFNNNTGATVQVDRTNSAAIRNFDTSTFTNGGTVTIGAIASVGSAGIDNEGMFDNNPNGQVNVDNTTSTGISTSGTVTNGGTITIGGNASLGSTGVNISSGGGSFDNENGGTLNIDNTTSQGIFLPGTFTNSGTVTVGAIANIGNYGIFGSGSFTNNSDGQVNIDRGNVGTFMFGAGSFTNNGTVTIGQISAPSFAMTASNFTQSGGTFNGTGTVTASTFTITGGSLSPGYSPGTMTFDAAEDFSNAILSIEIEGLAGAGLTGGHDQIVVNGTPTLGGTAVLNVTNGYSPTNGDQVVILDGISAVSGTFSSSSSLNGWFLNYDHPNPGDVTLSFGAALPVELVSFSAKEKDCTVLLDWQTASETNNEGFFVERWTVDGGRWTDIGFVFGHGSTVEAQSYFFQDEEPMEGMNYYRLRQMDFDGASEYSKVVSIDITSLGDLGSLRLYPNPSPHGKLTIFFPTEMEEATLTLFGSYGQMVSQKTVSGKSVLVDFSNLSAGIYFVDLRSGHQRWSERMVVE